MEGRHEQKLFEMALAECGPMDDNQPDWSTLEQRLFPMSPLDIRTRFGLLRADVFKIDVGMIEYAIADPVPVPQAVQPEEEARSLPEAAPAVYVTAPVPAPAPASPVAAALAEAGAVAAAGAAVEPKRNFSSRNKCWSEDEHRRFLEGLAQYGKGDWRRISRHCVLTRTPTQVASHAQKYFRRQEEANNSNRKRRRSIHDMILDRAEAE